MCTKIKSHRGFTLRMGLLLSYDVHFNDLFSHIYITYYE